MTLAIPCYDMWLGELKEAYTRLLTFVIKTKSALTIQRVKYRGVPYTSKPASTIPGIQIAFTALAMVPTRLVGSRS